MTGKGYVWLVTEEAMKASNIPVGSLGLKLKNTDNEIKHIKDSL